ncbi:MAG: LemA family protein [Bacilli bacterium]|nr:LemA family protein [Bacilli bacterium]MDD4407163.1 LemA family protein [Bacilli bacterium]
MEWLYIIIALIGILIIYVICIYNSLVILRQKVKNQWSQIDVQLKRRSDLIPNLVETVKGYAKHEKETLQKVIEARNSYLAAGTLEAKMKANGELSNLISKLFALSENYPELKADTSFLKLQSDLKDTEDKIAYARQFYNDIVMKFNAKIETFPVNVVANLFKFEAREFFEAQEAEKETVHVKF